MPPSFNCLEQRIKQTIDLFLIPRHFERTFMSSDDTLLHKNVLG